MLKKNLPAFALIVIIIGSFAFRPIINRTSTFITCDKVFRFDGGSVDDPTNYTDITGTSPSTFCPSPGHTLCVLCVKTSVVYTQADADASPSDQITNDWVGQPKVDQSGFHGDINTAVTNGANFSGTDYDIYTKP